MALAALYASARLSRLIAALHRFSVSAHSQMRSTFQPLARKARDTRTSRAWFRSIFSFQNFCLDFGRLP